MNAKYSQVWYYKCVCACFMQRLYNSAVAISSKLELSDIWLPFATTDRYLITSPSPKSRHTYNYSHPHLLFRQLLPSSYGTVKTWRDQALELLYRICPLLVNCQCRDHSCSLFLSLSHSTHQHTLNCSVQFSQAVFIKAIWNNTLSGFFVHIYSNAEHSLVTQHLSFCSVGHIVRPHCPEWTDVHLKLLAVISYFRALLFIIYFSSYLAVKSVSIL